MKPSAREVLRRYDITLAWLQATHVAAMQAGVPEVREMVADRMIDLQCDRHEVAVCFGEPDGLD